MSIEALAVSIAALAPAPSIAVRVSYWGLSLIAALAALHDNVICSPYTSPESITLLAMHGLWSYGTRCQRLLNVVI
jgi:hypothetical protein